METIQFKDENLKNAILFEMKWMDLIDAAADEITENNALKVTELGLSNNHITSIEGIAKFKNLTKLYLAHNHLSDLTPLAGLSKLETLALNHNNISDITDLTNLTNLERLYLERNPIADIRPLSNLTNLETLALNHTKLRTLNLEHNYVSNFKPLTSLTNLKLLFLDDDQIAAILQATKTEEEFLEVISKLEYVKQKHAREELERIALENTPRTGNTPPAHER